MASGAHLWSWEGEELWLLPERALFWPRTGSLLVADAHFGKSALFRLQGMALPPGTTATDAERLRALVRTTGACEVVFLGDTLHAPAVKQTGLVEILQEFTTDLGARCVALPGNHDAAALPLLEQAGFEVVEAPCLREPFLWQHEPPDDPAKVDRPVICGHLHPGYTPPRQFGPRWRVPCFWRSGGTLHLPAFGSFTGLTMVVAQPDDEVFLVSPEEIVALRLPKK
jgi:DNA ligase-associated metallophosphoesterase